MKLKMKIIAGTAALAFLAFAEAAFKRRIK